jgi:hypothetical protein
MSLSVRVPQLVPASLNSREHWRVKAARVKRERAMVRLVLSSRTPPELPVVVTLVRCSPRLLDSDNAVGAMKAVRDQAAAWLGVDDRDPRVTWRVRQMKTPKLRQGTLVRVEARTA